MAYEIAAIPTLGDFTAIHLLQAFWNDFSYSCAAVNKISTDIARSLCDSWVSCLLGAWLLQTTSEKWYMVNRRSLFLMVLN